MASSWTRPARFYAGLCLLLPILCAGCGGSSYGHVHGRVLLKDGKPLPGGTITFFSEDGRGNPASGPIDEDGTYNLRRVPVGAVRIAVSNEELKEGSRTPVGMAPQETRGAAKAVVMHAKGPPPGVQVGPPPEAFAKMSQKPPTPTAPDRVGKYVPIRAKYADPKTSGLGYDVEPGDQTFDVELR